MQSKRVTNAMIRTQRRQQVFSKKLKKYPEIFLMTLYFFVNLSLIVFHKNCAMSSK